MTRELIVRWHLRRFLWHSRSLYQYAKRTRNAQLAAFLRAHATAMTRLFEEEFGLETIENAHEELDWLCGSVPK